MLLALHTDEVDEEEAAAEEAAFFSLLFILMSPISLRSWTHARIWAHLCAAASRSPIVARMSLLNMVRSMLWTSAMELLCSEIWRDSWDKRTRKEKMLITSGERLTVEATRERRILQREREIEKALVPDKNLEQPQLG